MIDLRSDTLTEPTDEMREAMAAAAVGDDVYAEDPTVRDLQDRVAAMFGKESALFVPSGTMGNQICLAIHAGAGDEVVADSNAHIFHYENGAASVIARVQIHSIQTVDGAMPLDAIHQTLRPPAYYYPQTKLIAVENTHNRHGGTVLSVEYLTRLRDLAQRFSIPIHCDGARIWNACIAQNVSYLEMGAHFDTMSVCLSKGLGAPVGSLILGTQNHIDVARRWRKMLGGGMRQSGVLAAAGMYALDALLPLLPTDHSHASLFAEGISTIPGVTVELWRVQSNIVLFTVPMADADFVRTASAAGLRIAPIYPGMMRAVFYHQITTIDTVAAIDIVRDVVQNG